MPTTYPATMTIQEAMDYGSSSGGSYTLGYIVRGCNDGNLVRLKVMETAPATYGSNSRQDPPDVTPVYVDTATTEAEKKALWKCTVNYPRPGSAGWRIPEIGSVKVRATTKGGTMRIMQSLSTRMIGACELSNLINISDGRPQGIDIIRGARSFTITKIYPVISIPNFEAVEALTGCTNSATFSFKNTYTNQTWTYAAGACLFCGADYGDPRNDGCLEVSYDIQASKNMTGLYVDDVGPFNCGAWEVIDPVYMQLNGATTRYTKAIDVKIHRVYESGDFSVLGNLAGTT